MDFAKISNYTIEIYFVLFYFGQRLYISSWCFVPVADCTRKFLGPLSMLIKEPLLIDVTKIILKGTTKM
jgi:hypothetical protein